MGPDSDKAKQAAFALLERFANQRPPIKVEQIARSLGAEITYDRFDDDQSVSAMLYRDAKKVVIGVNSYHPITRQRFSIAHEIGHMLLHEGDLYVDRSARINFRNALSSQATNPAEIEANVFAAELLMPEKMVTREAYRLVEDQNVVSPDELISTLAVQFKVSNKAMGYRLENLKIITASIDD